MNHRDGIAHELNGFEASHLYTGRRQEKVLFLRISRKQVTDTYVVDCKRLFGVIEIEIPQHTIGIGELKQDYMSPAKR